MLEPRTADGVEAVIFDVLLDAVEGVGVELLEPEVLLCGGRGELVVWPSVHEVALGCPASCDFLLGLGVAPQPGGIDMATPIQVSYTHPISGISR